jgi:archaellum component FlaD/FlaE
MSTTWKSRLGKLELLIRGSGNRVFEIATELRELCNDKEFLADACQGSLDEAEEKLSRFTDTTGFYLNELLQMLEHFPNQTDWKDGHLRHLRDEMCRSIAKKEKERRASPTVDSKGVAGTPVAVTPIKRRVVTIAEYEELERANEELERKYKASQAEIRRLRQEYERLLDKIPQLARLDQPVKVKAK